MKSRFESGRQYINRVNNENEMQVENELVAERQAIARVWSILAGAVITIIAITVTVIDSFL